jgi:hypothetical protein
MTAAEILASIRNLVNEQSGDAGALLSDTGNLLDFAYDAAEQVVNDLLPHMPHLFLTSENVTLVASQANYTLANEFSQIYKVERYQSGKSPKEIPIIDPLKLQFYTNIGETEDKPSAVYFQGKTLYVVKTPSVASGSSGIYLRIWEVVPEPAAIPVAGPTYIPRMAHRLIVYWGAYMAATSIGVDPTRYLVLYQKRLAQTLKLNRDRYQQEPRFVREAVTDRMIYDDREPYFYDTDWPD